MNSHVHLVAFSMPLIAAPQRHLMRRSIDQRLVIDPKKVDNKVYETKIDKT